MRLDVLLEAARRVRRLCPGVRLRLNTIGLGSLIQKRSIVSELAEVFFEGFARGSQCNLHMRQHAGDNLHHVIEISFKAFARALRQATEIDPRVVGVPSTKGTLSE